MFENQICTHSSFGWSTTDIVKSINGLKEKLRPPAKYFDCLVCTFEDWAAIKKYCEQKEIDYIDVPFPEITLYSIEVFVMHDKIEVIGEALELYNAGRKVAFIIDNELRITNGEDKVYNWEPF